MAPQHPNPTAASFARRVEWVLTAVSPPPHQNAMHHHSLPSRKMGGVVFCFCRILNSIINCLPPAFALGGIFLIYISYISSSHLCEG
ncbi:hypothetical protein L208DRAFT_906836 [Tricholoma matsutake]|nr:hypothetical protein L208DRAFT_906836 [Tricholoma matsutake 945]